MKYFSKIKKAIVSSLIAVSLVLFGIGLAACNGSNNDAPELFGFEVGETITVDQYGLVLPKNVHVTDAEGTIYDVVVKVRDSKGNAISTDEGNKFNAYDADGYTITYSIETWEFSVTKTVQVVVNKATEIFGVELECDTLVSVGDTVTVTVDGSATNPTYSLSVVNKETGEKCPTDGLTFQPTQIGKYTVQVTVNADEGTATESMEIYARKPLQEGEVEVFDEDWLTVREFRPKAVAMEGTWTAATKDPDGKDGTYAVLETDAEYTHIYFGIRENRAYYRNLAMQGFTHVRFRVYVDSSTGRGKIFNWEHDSSNSWRTSLGTAPAGKWKEFYIPLTAGVAGTSDKKPGFIESYEYYQSTWILLLDNSTGDWNPNGREVDKDGNPISFKVYFDDVLAVRKTYETTRNTTLEKDVYDLSSMLNRAWGTQVEDYTYNVTKHTQYGTVQKKLVENADLTSEDKDLSALQGNDGAYGSYEIEYFIKGANTKIPYQRVWVDVLDPAQKMYAHPDLHNFSSARGMIWRYQDPTAEVKANQDGTITYTTAGSWGAGLQIAPAYELEYYKALQEEKYELTFDLKFDVQFSENVSDAVKDTTFKITSGSTSVNFKNAETHTIKISMGQITTYYQELKNVALGSNANDDWFGKYVLFFLTFDDKVYNESNHKQITFTISNLKMVKKG